MRKLCNFDVTDSAERFAAALDGRGVSTALRPESDGSVSLWILEEDQMPLARDELAEFEANPNDARFQVKPIRKPAEETPRPPRRHRPLPVWRQLPVTSLLIGLSIAVTLVTLLGEPLGIEEIAQQLRSDLSIASYVVEGGFVYWSGLDDVRSGQLWRLVTPIFPHGGPFHLLFNMMWLWLLGGAIETIRGSWRFLLLVLVTAVCSNVAEYYLNFGFTFDLQNGLQSDTNFKPSPLFLGMSGVVFGLFGFVWMRSRLLPRSGFQMPRDLVVWMMIWLVVCTSGVIGPIANVAHGVGLLSGMAIGATPRLWRKH